MAFWLIMAMSCCLWAFGIYVFIVASEARQLPFCADRSDDCANNAKRQLGRLLFYSQVASVIVGVSRIVLKLQYFWIAVGSMASLLLVMIVATMLARILERWIKREPLPSASHESPFLESLIPSHLRDSILGDMDEQLPESVEKWGQSGALIWYKWNVLKAGVMLRCRTLLRALTFGRFV